MTSFASCRMWCVAGLLALAAVHAHGEIIFDNTQAVTQEVASLIEGAMEAQRISPFATTQTLVSVALLARETVAGVPEVTLWSGNANTPTALVSTLVLQGSFTTTLGLNTFTAPGVVTLDPSVDYWIAFQNLSGGYEWAYTQDNANPDDIYGTNFATNWATFNTDASTWFVGGEVDPYQMKVEVVPEPSTVTLVGLGVVLMGYGHRRRRGTRACGRIVRGGVPPNSVASGAARAGPD